MLTDKAGALLTNVVTHLPELIRSGRSDSLIEYASKSRNDFLTVVEDRLAAMPEMGTILQTCLTLVSGYYLSALSLAIDIPGVNANKTLDKLSSNRDPLDSALGGAVSIYNFVGTEDFHNGLPSPDISLGLVGLEARGPNANGKTYMHSSSDRSVSKNYQGDDLTSVNVSDNVNANSSIERQQNAFIAGNSTTDDHRTTNNITLGGGGGGKGGGIGGAFGRDTIGTMQDLANMSVGKQFEVIFEADGNRKPVLVTTRLAVRGTDSESFKTILTIGGLQNTFRERLARARAGELAYINDLLLCNDLVEQAMKTRIRDRSGFFEHMMRKRSKNWLAGLLSMNPSVNNASAVLIFSAETAKKIQLELGGKLDDFRTRQHVFKNTAAMLMVVVDEQWKTVTIYHRSLQEFNELRIRELERQNKGGGQDIEDILRAYTNFTAPNMG